MKKILTMAGLSIANAIASVLAAWLISVLFTVPTVGLLVVGALCLWWLVRIEMERFKLSVLDGVLLALASAGIQCAWVAYFCWVASAIG